MSEEIVAAIDRLAESLVMEMRATADTIPHELMGERVVLWQTTDHHMHGRLVRSTRDFLILKVDRNGEAGEAVPEDRELYIPITAVMLLHREEDEEKQYEPARRMFGENR